MIAIVFLVLGILIILVGIAFLIIMLTYKRTDGTLVEKGVQLPNQYDPNMPPIIADNKANASASRTNLLFNLNKEIGQIADSINQDTQLKIANYRNQDAPYSYQLLREKETAEIEAAIAEAKNRKAVADIATKYGHPFDVIREMILEELRIKSQMMMKEFDVNLEVDRTRQLKAVDVDIERQMAELGKEFGIVENLLPQYLINDLNRQLSEIHQVYERVKVMPEGEYKNREKKRVEAQINTLKRDIRERSKRLF